MTANGHCRGCGRSCAHLFCSKGCSGRHVGKRPYVPAGRLLDPSWRQARARKAGQASAAARQRLRRKLVAGLTPEQAWVDGYRTCRQQMRRHYEAWMRQELVRREQQRAQMARTEPAA